MHILEMLINTLHKYSIYIFIYLLIYGFLFVFLNYIYLFNFIYLFMNLFLNSLYFITLQRSGTRPVTKPLRSIRPEHRGMFHTQS